MGLHEMGRMYMDVTAGAIIMCVCIFSAFVIFKQQRTIDRLTDKLMARSYVEYKSMQGIKEEDVSPKKEEDEPKGWYDQ